MRLDLAWCQIPQRTPVADQLLEFDNQIRNFHNRWGASCWAHMVHRHHRRRGSTSTISSFWQHPCPKAICSTREFNLNPTLIGKCNSHQYPLNNIGGTHLAVSIQTGSTNTGLVYRKEHNDSRRVSSWKAECAGVSSHDGL